MDHVNDQAALCSSRSDVTLTVHLLFMTLNCLLIGIIGVSLLSAKASPMIDARQASLPSGWSAVGCYSDSTASRTLRVASYTDVTGMTIESCLAFCTPAGYKYAGVEFSRECYCDNVIQSPGAPISSNSCNMACTGDADEICGGSGAINVFQSNPCVYPNYCSANGTFQYTGCYQDGVSGLPRSLTHQLSISGGVTVESCTAACKAAGYTLAGLEFAQECWCDSYLPLATLSPDSDCNMVCLANSAELCGAGNRLAVYVDTTAPPLDLNTCLNSVQLQAISPPIFNFDLEGRYIPAFPGAPVSVPGLLANWPKQGDSNLQILAARSSTQPHTYSISSSGSLNEFTANPFPGYEQGSWALEPIPGTIFEFEVNLFGVPSTAIGSHFCAQPNFLSASTYIGPPLLSVNHQSAVWAFCGAGLTFQPNATNFPCSEIILAMTPPVV
ncbi:WSC domain-containing protein [Gymnopilus junonius]|uniref:WSC domain-containing protein n=1 Tax=Gymnopilus junonius TaxID=109634 RepID=A0A9P5NE12_GYMJU|nr:WSC domain-containing protein [Gymnopilus junonius]